MASPTTVARTKLASFWKVVYVGAAASSNCRPASHDPVQFALLHTLVYAEDQETTSVQDGSNAEPPDLSNIFSRSGAQTMYAAMPSAPSKLLSIAGVAKRASAESALFTFVGRPIKAIDCSSVIMEKVCATADAHHVEATPANTDFPSSVELL